MKNTNTQLKYSLYCYSWDWLDVVQDEEVMSRLQNALFKSKLLKAIDSAMVCSEEVDFRVITVHSINNIFHAGRLHNGIDELN